MTHEDRFTRAGGLFAGVTFVLAYVVLLFDPIARAEMWPWVISTGACLGLVIWDERRSPPERLALAFPASRTMHIIAFGPIAVIVHFLRTRWPSGAFRALAIAAGAGFAVTVPQLLVSAIASPQETLSDLPETIVALALAPLPLALIWGFFTLLGKLFDVQVPLVLLGIVLVFGSAAGIAVALHRPVWSIAVAVAVMVGAIARAVRDPRE